MNLSKLENLAKIGELKKEPYNEQEYKGLLHSGKMRLKDALNKELSHESRFDLAYNAAHAFALAALRRHGYRPAEKKRYLVFQVLPHTLEIDDYAWRILDKCHRQRNLIEYEGFSDIDEQLLDELVATTKILSKQITSL